jgi:hypothetical protein
MIMDGQFTTRLTNGVIGKHRVQTLNFASITVSFQHIFSKFESFRIRHEKVSLSEKFCLWFMLVQSSLSGYYNPGLDPEKIHGRRLN